MQAERTNPARQGSPSQPACTHHPPHHICGQIASKFHRSLACLVSWALVPGPGLRGPWARAWPWPAWRAEIYF